ncbi:MFS general substrate transporter [Dendrothele bispora CBS 962.96]|uniref:MFS general substrate transporter n=1 Tax=Dendrothele bispora (strain CBS 962.96) TaxID=1314807 RepID=A0A4S8MNT4_DENBC|nr:MFS general substrate transporter [Dendrothele bispora CBS 962.96]
MAEFPSERTSDSTSQKATPSVTAGVKSDWRSVIWDTLNKPPEERRFLFKLDTALLTFATLGYFTKYLGQANINNAFVSGMKEDLSLFGEELNIMQTCWTVGYVIGQLPSNIILTKFRPSIWIPSMELLWTILTFCLSRCSTAKQIYVLRFFIGLAESTFYSGIQYVIGSWYRKDELAKRSCIVHSSGDIASMFSGYLMAAVYHLGGKAGLKGWQWLFVVDGIISLPIALAGFFAISDVPEISKPFYLTPEQVALARRRMQLEGRKPREPYTKAKVKKFLTSWHIYALTLVHVLFSNANLTSQPAFAQWLKASTDPKYTVAQINAYPTTTYALAILVTLIFAWSSDTIFRGARWPPMIFAGVWNIIVFTSLAIWDIPIAWHWACYILAGFDSGTLGLCISWAHEICTEDNEERAIVIGIMSEMAYMVQAWLPLIIWRQTDAPQYHKGMITTAVVGGPLAISATLLTAVLQRRETAQKKRKVSVDDDPKTDIDKVEPLKEPLHFAD